MAKVLTGDFSRKQQKNIQQVSADKPLPGYRLKLAVAFSDPLIWRSIQVPGTMTLAALHQVIQVCMGWDNRDTHQFLVGKIFYQSGFGLRDTKRDAAYDEDDFELHQLEEGMQFLFTYLYDGGEGWELEISLEEVIRNGLEEDIPVLLGGARACPPAEVGDIHSYQSLLADAEAAGDSRQLNLPSAAGFDPARFDRKAIKDLLAELVSTRVI
jgi:hypothetical protein